MRKPTPRSPLRLLYSATLGLALSPVIKVPAVSMPPRNLARRISIRDTGPAIVEQELGELPVGSGVLLAIQPLMGHGHNGNPLCMRRRHAGVRHRHRGRAGAKPLKGERSLAMDPPICNPSRLCQNLAGIPGSRLESVTTSKGINLGTGRTAGSMIMNTSFLMKIIHRISARIILGERSLPEISAGYRTWLVRARRAGSDSGARHATLTCQLPGRMKLTFLSEIIGTASWREPLSARTRR